MKKNLLPGVASLFGRPPHAGTAGGWLQRLLLAAAVLLPALGQAQVTVPAANTATTTARRPFSAYYGYERSAIVYRANEINAVSGNISSVGFYLSSITTAATVPVPVKIYLKTVGTTSGFAAATTVAAEETGATLVFNATIPASSFVANTWVTATLSSAFAYNGTDNLEVIVESNYGGGGSGEASAGRAFRFSSATGGANAHEYWNTDNSPSTAVATATSLSRPNVQLGGLTARTCAAATGVPVVSTITATGASVAFTTVAGTTNYTVTTVPATTTYNVTASPVALTGLTAGNTYRVEVAGNCGGGVLAAPALVSFTTTASCAAPTALTITNTTTNSASLSFTSAASGVTNYTVTTTPATSTYTVASAPTATPLSLTGLSSGTSYTVNVLSNCTVGGTSTTATTIFNTLSPAPANDECSGAISLTSATTCTPTTGTTLGATASTAPGTCAGTADDDVWYSFVATSTQHTITVVGGTNFDAVVNLRSGACPGVLVGSCADASGSAGTETIAATGLTMGATYYVRVYEYYAIGSSSGAPGSFTICVTNPAACAAPTTVSAGTVTTTSASITFSGGNGNTSYTLTATPTTGAPVTATGTTSPIALPGLTPSTTYSLVVAGNCGAAGASTPISFTTLSPAPANDECAGAISLTSATTCTPTTGTTLGATTSTAPGTCAGTADDDVWYSFVATNTQHTITVVGNASFDAVVNLRSGACPGVLVGSCADASSAAGTETIAATGLTMGATYYVRVYSYSSTAPVSAATGGFTICVTNPAACAAPTTVSAGTITTTSASITFSGGNGNTSYTLTATPTTGAPVTATGTASPIALTGLTPGMTYSLVITGNCGAAGASAPVSFTTVGPPPANDQCAGAIAIACGQTLSGTTTNATTTGDPTAVCGGTNTPSASPSVFYSFVGTGDIVTVTTCGAGTIIDTELFVYSGTCGALTCVDSNDDFSGCSANTAASTVTFTSVAGTTYYFMVQRYSSTTAVGDFALSLSCTPVPNLVVNPGNSPYSASGTFNNVTIQNGGTANLSADLTVNGTLTINDGGTLNTAGNQVVGAGNFVLQAGGTLGIRGTAGITAGPAATGVIRNTGATRSFSNDASYVYNGTAAQSTGNGLPATVRNITVNNSTGLTLSQALSVRQLVRLQSGNLATGGNTFTLLSVAGQGTALIDNTGGLVTGTGTMQRAIDVTNSAGIGYRHYSAPVSATTIGDLQATSFTPVLNSNYNSAASPGLVTPFPTVYGYDETRLATATSNFAAFDKGWFSPASTSTPMEANHGYTANIADGTLVDFVGTYNSGAQSRTGLTRGTDAQAGWHLLGNPYPSPLNWDLVDNTPATSLPGMDGSVYVFQSNGRYTGTYRSYVNGIGGNPIIDAGQGYFVRVTTAGTPGSVNLTDNHRVTTFAGTVQPTFGRGTADVRPLLSLSVTGNGQADETSVYFENGATNSHDPLFDAVKRPNMGTMSLGSTMGLEEFAINGLAPLTSLDVVVPLTISNTLVGSYHFDTEALRNFGSTTIWLRDATTGAQVNLSQGSRYSFTVATAGAGNGRFSLLFRPGTATANHAGFEAAQVLLFPNPAHGAFTVSVPSVANARTVQATLLNALGQQVLTRTLTLGATGAIAEFSTTNLAAGVYIMQLRAGDNLVTKRVVVE